MISGSTRPPSSKATSTSNSRADAISPVASSVSCLSAQPIRVLDSLFHSSGCVSSLASRVDIMSLMETRGPHQQLPAAVSPPILPTMVGSVLLKSFNDSRPSPIPIMDFEVPWYRYCRPTAPVPSMADRVEVASTPAAAAVDLLEGHPDQENPSPPHPPTTSPPFVQPLTAVSNILLSPIMFGERLPKWSVLRRSESNHMSRYPSSSLPELPNRAPFRSMDDGEPNADTISTRNSPQTPPISIFNRRRSWFTSHAAPGVARPTVLKHGPTLSFDPVATRANDFHSLKRSAANSRSTSEELSIKRIRAHSLVPSERSAFLPVVHRRGSMANFSDPSSVVDYPINAVPSPLPLSSI